MLVWAAQSAHVRNVPQVTWIYWHSCVHLLSKKPGEENHYFLKRKQKQKSARVLQKKTASHTWNVTRMGFQLKHGKPLMSVTAMTLDSAPSSVLGRAKQKRWADKRGECHSTRIPYLRKERLNIHVSYLQSPPTTTTILLNVMLHILFCFSSYISRKGHFFSLSAIPHNSSR